MSIHQAIKTMLHSVASVANANTVYGIRNQTIGTFPYITYLIDDIEILSIGTAPLRKCRITVKAYHDESAESAASIGEDVSAAILTGTYDTIVFQGCAEIYSILQEPTESNGDETEPFVCTTTASIFYST